jgi:hypothetical protein
MFFKKKKSVILLQKIMKFLEFFLSVNLQHLFWKIALQS